MKITRTRHEALHYSELSFGDVFVTKYDEEKVYMKTEFGFGAVNLEDGRCYNIEDGEPVRKLDAELIIE